MARTLALVFVLALPAGCAREPAPRDVIATPTTMEAPAAPGGSVPVEAGEIRYLALGDSFTIGTGARPIDAFPSRLEPSQRGTLSISLAARPVG